jgi:hypothetical protein
MDAVKAGDWDVSATLIEDSSPHIACAVAPSWHCNKGCSVLHLLAFGTSAGGIRDDPSSTAIDTYPHMCRVVGENLNGFVPFQELHTHTCALSFLKKRLGVEVVCQTTDLVWMGSVIGGALGSAPQNLFGKVIRVRVPVVCLASGPLAIWSRRVRSATGQAAKP